MTADPEDNIGVQGRAARAKVELSETEAACNGLRQAMLERIVQTGAEQTQLRDRLIAGVQIIDALRKALFQAVAAGEMANYQAILAENNILRP